MASPDPSNSDPAQVLNYILNSMPPATFVSRLCAALDPAMGYDSEDIQSLLNGLANVGFERAVKQAGRVADKELRDAEDGRDEQHCVRCHKEYRETENGYEACKIQHTHTYTSATLKAATHTHERCLSCHKVPPPSAIVEEKCITARHTANVKDIKERSALLRTCVEAGCGRKAPTAAAKLLDGHLNPLRIEAKASVKPENDEKEIRSPFGTVSAKSAFTFGQAAPSSPVSSGKAPSPTSETGTSTSTAPLASSTSSTAAVSPPPLSWRNAKAPRVPDYEGKGEMDAHVALNASCWRYMTGWNKEATWDEESMRRHKGHPLA